MRQPVGVVAAITPFNFPAMIPLWFLPYAIACGNTFVLKPSERDPRPSELIFELIDAIEEIPDGVCNLVHGARDAVNGLLDHPEVDAISFVGQASTARYIAERSAAAGKRFQALGGAKNSLVVMPDADLELTRAGDHVARPSAPADSAAWPARSRSWSARREEQDRTLGGAERRRGRPGRRPRRPGRRRGLPAGRPGGARPDRGGGRGGRRRGRTR